MASSLMPTSVTTWLLESPSFLPLLVPESQSTLGPYLSCIMTPRDRQGHHGPGTKGHAHHHQYCFMKSQQPCPNLPFPLARAATTMLRPRWPRWPQCLLEDRGIPGIRSDCWSALVLRPKCEALGRSEGSPSRRPWLPFSSMPALGEAHHS